MFFTINNTRYISVEQLRTSTLLKAYYVVQKYPLHATELALDQFLQQQYNMTLKNMCIKLLLNLTYYDDNSGHLILMFKDPKWDQIARLITYGNGVIQGSKILKTALNT